MKNSLLVLELVECLGKAIKAETRRRGTQHQLLPVHMQALAYLERANRYSNTPQALTEYLGLTKGTVSQSLLLLCRRGLVLRETDVKDRRVVRLNLSQEGIDLLREFSFVPEWQEASQGLPPDDLQTTTATLRKILRALQTRNGGRTFGVCNSCRYCHCECLDNLRCGLTGEPLSTADLQQLCREHSLPEKAPQTTV